MSMRTIKKFRIWVLLLASIACKGPTTPTALPSPVCADGELVTIQWTWHVVGDAPDACIERSTEYFGECAVWPLHNELSGLEPPGVYASDHFLHGALDRHVCVCADGLLRLSSPR